MGISQTKNRIFIAMPINWYICQQLSDRIIIFSAMSSFYFLYSNKLIILEWLHPKKKPSYATTFQMHSAISIMLHNILYLSCLAIKID
jgi:hypothetical protein